MLCRGDREGRLEAQGGHGAIQSRGGEGKQADHRATVGCIEASGSPSWPEDERQQGPPGGDGGRSSGRERGLKGWCASWRGSHGRTLKDTQGEMCRKAAQARWGVWEGSWGQGRPCRGHQHTGKPPRQGFKQDGEVSGAGSQKEQAGCSRGEAGDEARAGAGGRGPCLGYVRAVEMSDSETFLGGVTRMW